MTALRIALRLLSREWRIGELRVLLLAVLIAVAGMASVNAFTARMQYALALQGNRLLAADLVLVSDSVINPSFVSEAQGRALRTAQTEQFPSMVGSSHGFVLADIQAVNAGYPLRGHLRISPQMSAVDRVASSIPAPGTVWLEAGLADALHAYPGAFVHLGNSRFTVADILTDEPDRSGEFFQLAPRLLMNLADIPATGLVATGSRVTYRLLIAGDTAALGAEHAALAVQITRGQKLVSATDARPQVRNTLDQADRYLGLSALLAALLAGVAILLASRHFIQRHLDDAAMLRCFGASHWLIVTVYAWQMMAVGLLAAGAGIAVGYVGEEMLAVLMGRLIHLDLPAVDAWPFIHAGLAGLLLLAGFSLPALMALRQVSAIRILRREAIKLTVRSAFTYFIAWGAMLLLMWWQVHDVQLAITVLMGMSALLSITAVSAWLLILTAGWVGEYSRGSWRHGLLNLKRRAVSNVIQIAALTVGLFALLLLTQVRSDMVEGWQATLPANGPNRFVINIQPDQLASLRRFFQSNGLSGVKFYPMVHARLVAINGKLIQLAAYPNQQTQRLLEREFNLSYADQLGAEAHIIAGNGWRTANAPPQFSVEQGFADRLRLKLGDTLQFNVVGMQFNVAGTPVSAPITSLRTVKWDSFQVNFFVISNTALLRNAPTSYITSFYVPPSQRTLLNVMVNSHPNLTVIDVSAVLHTVQALINRISVATEFIFIFSLASGFTVMYAALATSRDERILETALWRVFGARRSQVWIAQLTEFALMGGCAGLLAAVGASLVEWRLSTYLFKMPSHVNTLVWLLATGTGALSVAWVGVAVLWNVSKQSPRKAF